MTAHPGQARNAGALRHQTSPDGPRRLTLALFLVLLCSFIVFVSMSSFDDHRVSEAIEGLEDVFANGGLVVEQEVTAETVSGQGGADLLDRLEGLSRGVVAIAREPTRGGPDAFVMTLSETIIEGRDRAYFIDSIAEVLRDPPAGQRYEMMATLGTGGPPQLANPLFVEDSIARLSGLIEDLLDASAPPTAPAIGLSDRAPGNYRFEFRAWPAREARR